MIPDIVDFRYISEIPQSNSHTYEHAIPDETSEFSPRIDVIPLPQHKLEVVLLFARPAVLKYTFRRYIVGHEIGRLK